MAQVKMQDYLYDLATDREKGIIAGGLKVILFILSLAYGWAVRACILFYRFSRPHCLNCRVISVGNITWGGTGKTSLVEFIARYLKEQGHKAAILSRGYKRKVASEGLGVTSYENMGDEPYMLAQRLKDIPVIVHQDRVKAARAALNDFGADTVILDDGLQQWRIKKDLEIVTIDAASPFGNRRLIPRGILREPLSALKRADIFVLVKTNLHPDTQKIRDFLAEMNPDAPIIESVHQPVGLYKIGSPQELLNPDLLKAKAVTLFSGIGSPDSFAGLIKSLGIKVGLFFRFPDHYNYTENDLGNIMKKSRENNIGTIITTEKDAVRLSSGPLAAVCCPADLLVLRIALKVVKNEQELVNRLLRLYPA